MDIAFPARLISDLHLGHSICTVQRAEQLAPLTEGIATLILNGDTYEDRLPRFRAASQVLLDGLREICSQRSVQLVPLNGNHDPASWPHDSVELFGGKFIAHHGHAFFRNVSPWSAKLKYCQQKLDAIWAEYTPEEIAKVSVRYELARRCSQTMLATEVVQRGSGILAKLEMAAKEIWPPRRPWNVAKVWLTLPKVATGFLERFYPEAKVFCFGHTHRAAYWMKKGRLLVNTGGFVSFASPLCVDIQADASLRIRKIRKLHENYTPIRTLVEHRIPQ